MKTIWLTDIHLERLNEAQWQALLTRIQSANADAILITGDIGEPPLNWTFLESLFCAFAKPVYFVLGNHDFYQKSIDATRIYAKNLSMAYPNAFYLTAEPGFHFGRHFILGVGGWANTGKSALEEQTWDCAAIDDFKRLDKEQLKDKLNQLAEIDAQTLIFKCQAGIHKETEKVFIFTHVPPLEAMSGRFPAKPLQHKGTIYYSTALSSALNQLMRDFPKVQFEVYSGHMHMSQEYQISDQLHGFVANKYKPDDPFNWIEI